MQFRPSWKYHQGSKNITVQGNGGNLAVTRNETVTEYKKYVWCSKYATTNIIDLKNLSKQYRVTYDNIDKIFVVHREDQ